MPQRTKLLVGDEAPDFTAADVAGESFSPSNFKDKQHVVLMFLRYIGCPICRMEMGELRRRYAEFRERGAEALVILETPAEKLREYSQIKEFPFRLVPDPRKEIFALYGVRRGPLTAGLHPDVLGALMRATVKGFFHGRFGGDEQQLPGDFIVGRDGRLLHARVGRHFADNTPLDDLLIVLEKAQ